MNTFFYPVRLKTLEISKTFLFIIKYGQSVKKRFLSQKLYINRSDKDDNPLEQDWRNLRFREAIKIRPILLRDFELLLQFG